MVQKHWDILREKVVTLGNNGLYFLKKTICIGDGYPGYAFLTTQGKTFIVVTPILIRHAEECKSATIMTIHTKWSIIAFAEEGS